jgi:hypothetical protein
MKRKYEKPSMEVCQIKMSQLICTSPGGDPNWWDEPGGLEQF